MNPKESAATTVVKVHCIGQERWFIRKQHCKCGNKFEDELIQDLIGGQDGFFDEITVRCRCCGTIATFRFDISSCAAHLQLGLRKKIEVYSKVMPEDEAAQLLMVPMMERVIGFIEQLGEARDALGLRFIAESVDHAQRRMSGDCAPNRQ